MAKGTSETVNWEEGLIIKTFGLTKIFEGYPLLDAWLTVENDLDAADIQLLEKRRHKLVRSMSGWNEETLKMKFIALLLDMVEYDSDIFEGTFDAELKGVVQGKRLSVVADYAVSKSTFGFKEQPYFYFHEYKPRKRANDPFAQLLLAMLIAQEKHEHTNRLYGCAVIGENWYFMILDGKTYSISTGFLSTHPDGLQKILLILRKFKHILNTELAV